MLLIWPDAMDAIAVFQRCIISAIGGMGVHFQGISASEIRAALLLSGLPRSRWPEISADLTHMGQAAATALNKQFNKSTAAG